MFKFGFRERTSTHRISSESLKGLHGLSVLHCLGVDAFWFKFSLDSLYNNFLHIGLTLGTGLLWRWRLSERVSLCFVQRKCAILTFDDLVSVCAIFYQLKEIEKAKKLLSDYLPQKRLTKLKRGSERDKTRKTVINVKVCLDLSVHQGHSKWHHWVRRV